MWGLIFELFWIRGDVIVYEGCKNVCVREGFGGFYKEKFG